MKKALFSLLMTIALLPSAFAQSKAGHIEIINDTACGEYTWTTAQHGTGMTYTTDTTVMNRVDTITYVLNLTMLPGTYDTATAIPVVGTCYGVWTSPALRGGQQSIVLRNAGDTLVALRAANGCDSIVKLNVTLSGIQNVNIDTTVCGSYLAPWGETITSSVVNDNLSETSNGCNYIGILHVTIKENVLGATQQVEAGCSYTWGDNVITDQEVHTMTIAGGAANGCDSIASIQVASFSGHNYDTIDIVACDTLITSWGAIVTTSGFFSHDTVINGCTTTTVLNVTIDHKYTDRSAVVVEEIAGGCSVTWMGHTFNTVTTEPTYETLHTVLGGCDSLAAVKVVSLSQKDYDTTTVAHCGNRYTWNGQNYTAAGAYDDSTVVNGCTTYQHLILTFTNNHTTKTIDSCYAATLSMKRTNASGQLITVTSRFFESGVYDVDNNNDTLYEVDFGTKCKTYITADIHITAPDQLMRNSEVVDTVCESKRFKFDGTNYNLTATVLDSTFRSIHHNVSKCYDSLVVVSVVVNNKTFVDTTVSACDHFRWDATGVDYTASTVVLDTLSVRNEFGCLNIKRLDLTINKAPHVTITGETHLLPGGSTTLTAVSDEENVNYRWYKNNSATPLENYTNTLQLNNVTENVDIYLQTTNTNNCMAENWVTVTSTVGIDDVDALQVNVYPNPASRFLTVESASAMSSVEVFNALGQKVIANTIEGTHTQLDLSGLTAGNYTLRIVSQNGELSTRKFIVNK